MDACSFCFRFYLYNFSSGEIKCFFVVCFIFLFIIILYVRTRNHSIAQFPLFLFVRVTARQLVSRTSNSSPVPAGGVGVPPVPASDLNAQIDPSAGIWHVCVMCACGVCPIL